MTYGLCVIQRNADDTLHVLQADPTVLISRQLLDEPHDDRVTVDGGVLTIHADPVIRYRLGEPGPYPETVVGRLEEAAS